MMKRWGTIAGALIGLVLVSGCATPSGVPGGQTTGGDSWQLIIFLVLIVGIFYFLMIRPQRKRQQQHQKLVQELHKGDKIVTIGGMYGEVDSVGEDSIVIKVQSGAAIKMARNSIATKLQ